MEKTYTIPQRMLTNTVAALNGYETRLEGAIDVLATIPAGQRLVEPHTKLLAVVHELAEFYTGLLKEERP